MTSTILRGDALALPIADESVDLVVTSPPYFALRSYTDGGEHYAGQLGSEATPAEFVAALIAATREMVRVLKPSGSIWVNLGDKYAGHSGGNPTGLLRDRSIAHAYKAASAAYSNRMIGGAPTKSLMGMPWRYALRCIDELGLILRAEVIWDKPNSLPEYVTDRVRRSHEQWFHFTREPRYYSAIDEIREPHTGGSHVARKDKGASPKMAALAASGDHGVRNSNTDPALFDPRGKLPGSVWTIPSEPLTVPDELGVDHFAAFPTEWPRRIIAGWSPREVCTACGQGRRPVVDRRLDVTRSPHERRRPARIDPSQPDHDTGFNAAAYSNGSTSVTIVGYSCACPTTDAASTPGVVLDPFGGTGTVALVADALGRHGLSVDLSGDYCRLAQWRTTDPRQRAKAARVDPVGPVPRGQLALDFEDAS